MTESSDSRALLRLALFACLLATLGLTAVGLAGPLDEVYQPGPDSMPPKRQ